MSLREAIKDIIWSVDAKFDDNRPTMDADYYTNLILKELEARKPKKKHAGQSVVWKGDPRNPIIIKDPIEAYNQAISDFERVLKGDGDGL